MRKSYRLIVFDWEGTLGDTLGSIICALIKESENLKVGPVDTVLARTHLMEGLAPTIKKLFPQLSSFQHQQLSQNTQNALVTRTNKVYLLPGALDFVEKAHRAGLDLAIASNKSQHSLQRQLIHSGMEQLFTVTRTATQAPPKPCPQMLEEIMDFCGVPANETLMIGDSVVDIEMATYAKVDGIGIDFYNQESQQKELLKAGALAVFTNYQQFSSFLKLSHDD